MSLAQPTYGQINAEQNDRLREVAPDRDGPLFMLNLMRYRPLAVYEDGRETTLTGMQTDDVYAPVEILPNLSAEIVLFGDVVDQPRGSEGWHRVAIVRYPTVQSFLQMQEKADFIERHQHQDAGREESAVIATCTSLSGGLEVATGPLLVDLVTTDPEAVVARAGEAVLRVDHILIGDATDPAVPGCRRSSVPAAMGRRAGLACAKDVRKRAPWEARLRKTAGQSRCRALSALAR